MEKSIKGTRTEQNLLKAFAGESQARSRYVFFASKAKKEGYEQIAGVFAETAEQEKEHAERFFKFLEGGDVEITASYPTGPIGTTAENLLAAAKGEKEEWDVLYREFAKVAEEEGFIEIATAFKMISTVEALDREALVRILVEPKNALVKQFKRLFELDGVDLEFTPDAIEAIAVMALQRGIGARGLRSILEEILLNVMYHVPSDEQVAQVLVDADVVSQGGAPRLVSRAELSRAERRDKTA